MASYLQIENISKSYGPKILFENIAFNVNEGDKIALIAPNGTGKTSLMRILAGKDKSDSGGSVKFLKQIRIAFLEQEYSFEPSDTVMGRILSGSGPFMEGVDPFEYERRILKLLTEFSISGDEKMGNLSGGEVKRVAIAEMLSTEADFFIMDEPTNHLDLDAIEFLESYLQRSRCTLLMVTHDRYFLDRVCNTVMELDHGSIYVYRGDYENFLEKRDERISNYNAETDKVRNILRRELEWMHATPCARTGKAKYRKQAFWDLKERASQTYTVKELDLSEVGASSRLGTKIIDCKDASFSFADKKILSHFNYNFQRYERVGIVGRNGIGKSTFVGLLCGQIKPSTGVIEMGESVKVGYYHQSGIQFDEDQTVLETVNDTRLLARFLFPHEMLNNRISKLSGGEKRRLYLLTILMQNPNLLILDEPTNDLDIVTLNVLEEYLLEFKGTLVIVSHDRHFLDRLVDHLLVFYDEGEIKDFIGTYTEYRTFIRDYEAEKKRQERVKEQPIVKTAELPSPKRKLSFKEKKELEQLELDMASLNEEKEAIEKILAGGGGSYDEIRQASERFQALKEELDMAELRWLELSEIGS